MDCMEWVVVMGEQISIYKKIVLKTNPLPTTPLPQLDISYVSQSLPFYIQKSVLVFYYVILQRMLQGRALYIIICNIIHTKPHKSL